MRKMPQVQTNTAVALIFFVRPNEFRQVFECVRIARPKKLFLIQDGPRNEKDIDKILECRHIAESVDWPCEVHRNYSEYNLGCGQRVYSGLKWAFEMVDSLIILEDDCIPSPSFFPFCDEVLEKYKTDDRICMVSGMNHLGESLKDSSDYFFSYCGSIAGWATWKRCWDAVDYDMDFLAEKDIQHSLYGIARYGPLELRSAAKKWQEMQYAIQNGGKMRSWSYQFGLSHILNSQLILVPTRNLMTNIGAVSGGTNTPDNEKLIAKAVQRIYHLPLYQYEFPIRHPRFVTVDYMYSRKVLEMMSPTGIRLLFRNAELAWRKLRYGGISAFFNAVKRRLLRFFDGIKRVFHG